jgi:hypothetical protein
MRIPEEWFLLPCAVQSPRATSRSVHPVLEAGWTVNIGRSPVVPWVIVRWQKSPLRAVVGNFIASPAKDHPRQ